MARFSRYRDVNFNVFATVTSRTARKGWLIAALGGLRHGLSHRWMPAAERMFELIATMNNVTSEIYLGFFVEEEGAMSTYTAFAEMMEANGGTAGTQQS